jgi:hypothetical protein
MSNAMIVYLVGTGLLHADGEVNVTKLIVAFCNFANTPKKTVHSMKKYKDTLIKHVSSSLFTSGTYFMEQSFLKS